MPGTPEFHKRCWFYRYPSCSIYTNRNHKAQYGPCNQAECFRASNPYGEYEQQWISSVCVEEITDRPRLAHADFQERAGVQRYRNFSRESD